MSNINTRDALYPLYRAVNPNDTSNVGQQVGQIARFLIEFEESDFVIVPSSYINYLYYGVIEKDSYIYEDEANCSYGHRNKTKWEQK